MLDLILIISITKNCHIESEVLQITTERIDKKRRRNNSDAFFIYTMLLNRGKGLKVKGFTLCPSAPSKVSQAHYLPLFF